MSLTDQPISFDEFISKALANGITHRSYKVRLAKFLDMQVRCAFSAEIVADLTRVSRTTRKTRRASEGEDDEVGSVSLGPRVC